MLASALRCGPRKNFTWARMTFDSRNHVGSGEFHYPRVPCATTDTAHMLCVPMNAFSDVTLLCGGALSIYILLIFSSILYCITLTRKWFTLFLFLVLMYLKS